MKSYILGIYRKMLGHKNTVRVVSISEALKNDLEAQFSINSEKMCVSHDGANEVSQPPYQLEANSAKLNAGYIGHLYPGKGMEIVAELAKRIPWVFFHIVGGKDKDIEFWQSELSELSNIKFYGFQHPLKAESLRLSMDVLLAPYRSEVLTSGKGDIARWMSPLKIFEYMAAGKIILASDIPVLKEVLEEKKNSILCSPDNMEEWEDAFNFILASGDETARIAENARRSFLEHHTWGKRAEYVLGNLNS